MKSLLEISSLSVDQIESLSLIEKCVFLFQNQKPSFLFEARKVSNSELEESLDYYGESLESFWSQIISNKNLEVFAKQDFLKEHIIDWFFSQDEFKIVQGKYNLNSSTLNLDPSTGKIFSLVDPQIFEDEISKLKNTLLSLDESLDRDIIVTLSQIDKHIDMTLQVKEEGPSKLKKCLELLSIPIFFAVVLSSSLSMADGFEVQRDSNGQFKSQGQVKSEMNSSAVNSATQAALKQTGMDKQIDKYSKQLEKKGQELAQTVKEYGGEVPGAIIAVGAKAVVDRKIGVKGKNDTVVPVNYEISVGMEESIVKISNDNLFDQHMQGWISGVHQANMDKIEVGVKYEF